MPKVILSIHHCTKSTRSDTSSFRGSNEVDNVFERYQNLHVVKVEEFSEEKALTLHRIHQETASGSETK